MATFKINGKNFATQSGTGEPTVSSNVVFPAGNIIKVEQATLTTASSVTLNTTFADISGLSKAITPSSQSNQILVLVQVHVGRQNGSDRSYPKIRLVRGSTNIAISTESDSRQLVTSMWDVASADANSTGVLSMNWMDSPSSDSEITYKVQIFGSQNRTFYVNQTGSDENTAGGNAVSTLTLMEIAR
jgi:hypothetical protein